MLKRVYIDNYKCFSNFEFKPAALNLLLGRNGTGKSTLLEALTRLRALALGESDAVTAFPPESRTRWDARREQVFTLEVGAADGLYSYTVQLEHRESARQCRVLREELTLGGQPLFSFSDGDVHLYRNDHSVGPVFPADWSRSALATVPERHDNTKLWWFKNWLRRLWTLSIDPRAMESESNAEAGEPAPNMTNLASWYRHVVQESPGELSALFKDLAAVLPGFTSLNLQQAGERTRHLTATFRLGAVHQRSGTPALTLGLEELSDGQRCLIALYGLLHLGLRDGVTLCVDEPDNFVALAEVQPWLAALRDALEERAGSQMLLTSHNREVINYLARDAGVLFERQDGGPARVRPFEHDETLLPAETIARGWE